MRGRMVINHSHSDVRWPSLKKKVVLRGWHNMKEGASGSIHVFVFRSEVHFCSGQDWRIAQVAVVIDQQYLDIIIDNLERLGDS
jgi:uncharacterized protein (DUF2141 family)